MVSFSGRDVQRKWKNIRDCFRKEINHQKRWKAGQGKRKRRKYIFYDQLLFLLPTIEERGRKGESSGEEAEENTEEISLDVEQPDKTAYKPLVWKQKGRKHPVYGESCAPVSQENEADEIDEDKYFLLSLLPSFKNLSPDQKFTAKIEFLQTLRNVTYPIAAKILTPSSVILHEQPHTSFQVRTVDDDDGSVHSPKLETDDF